MVRTQAEWFRHFRSQTLEWMQKQDAHVRHQNTKLLGLDYAFAFEAVLQEKLQTQDAPAPKRLKPSPVFYDEDEGEVEIVRCGGKGQTMRIVHPPVASRMCD